MYLYSMFFLYANRGPWWVRMPERAIMTPLKRAYGVVLWMVESLAWLPSAVGAASAIAAAFFLAQVGDPPDMDVGRLVWGLIFTALSVGVSVLNEVWRQQRRKQETAEAAETRVLLTDALEPLLTDIGRMPRSTKRVRETALVKIVGNACGAVPVALPDGKALRVIIYNIEPAANGRRRLTVMNSSGRKDKPGKLTDEPGTRGEAIFEALRIGDPVFVADMDKSPDHSIEGKRYRTFISAPIIANGECYGMLSVDSPHVGSLDENDVVVVEFIATLLAIAFAEAARPS